MERILSFNKFTVIYEIKIRDDNISWILRPTSKDNSDEKETYLPKSGKKLSGDIDLNQNDITNIPNTPATNSSVVNKKYVNDNYLPKSVTESIDMGKYAILSLPDISSLSSAANKQYVHNTFLPKLSGRMSGTLNMNRNNITNISDFVSEDSSVVNKKYVDDKTSKIMFYQNF